MGLMRVFDGKSEFSFVCETFQKFIDMKNLKISIYFEEAFIFSDPICVHTHCDVQKYETRTSNNFCVKCETIENTFFSCFCWLKQQKNEIKWSFLCKKRAQKLRKQKQKHQKLGAKTLKESKAVFGLFYTYRIQVSNGM